MVARGLAIAAAQLELTERGRIKGIVCKTIAIGDRAELLEPSFGTVTLTDGNRAI